MKKRFHHFMIGFSSLGLLVLAGCADISNVPEYDPDRVLGDAQYSSIDGAESNDNSADYSWNDDTNGYSDPYATQDDEEPVEQDQNYRPSHKHSGKLPSSVAYFNNRIGNVVHFSVDSIDLNEQSKAILQSQAQWLMQHHHRILIEGYTDNRGTRVYNIALGKHRASAVKNFLIKQGIPARSIKTVSYGMEHPVAVCQSERCWVKNRRAKIVIK